MFSKAQLAYLMVAFAILETGNCQSGFYLFKSATNPLWCMSSGGADSYNSRMAIKHCTLTASKYVIMELVEVAPESYIIRANTSFIGVPQPPDEIRCFQSPTKVGGYNYGAPECSPLLELQQFKVLQVGNGEWLIKNEGTNICPFQFERLDTTVLSAVCDETDPYQLWIREPY